MPAKFDPTAPRKKYRLKRFARIWNLKHPLKRIKRPKGFNPKTKKIGKPARDYVRNMQRRTGLKVTGQFDERTMLRLFPPNVRSRVMAKVHSQLGIHEWPSGSNRGPVEKYLAAVGLGGGYPWCAAFVTWVLKQLDFEAFPPNPASAHSWAVWAKAKGITKPIAQSKRGDLWVYEYGNSDGLYDHIAFCDDDKPGDTTAYSLDGNAGAYGGSVTEVSRSSVYVAVCIDIEKLWNLK